MVQTILIISIHTNIMYAGQKMNVFNVIVFRSVFFQYFFLPFFRSICFFRVRKKNSYQFFSVNVLYGYTYYVAMKKIPQFFSGSIIFFPFNCFIACHSPSIFSTTTTITVKITIYKKKASTHNFIIKYDYLYGQKQ